MRSNFEFTGAQGCDRVHWQVRRHEQIATSHLTDVPCYVYSVSNYVEKFRSASVNDKINFRDFLIKRINHLFIAKILFVNNWVIWKEYFRNYKIYYASALLMHTAT